MMRRSRRSALDKRDVEIPDTPIQWMQMLRYLVPYWRRLLLSVIALFIGSALSLVFPVVIQQVVDTVLETNDVTMLNQVTLFLLLVFIVRSVSTFFESYNLKYVGERVVIDVRRDLYNHLQAMSLSFYTEYRVGELVSRVSSDVSQMRNVIVNNTSTALQQILITIGSVAVMFILNWRLTLFIIALVPVMVLIGFGFGYYLRRLSMRIQDELAGAMIVSEEVFQNIREVKSFVREPYEISRHDAALNRAFDAAFRLQRLRALVNPIIAFLGFGGLTMILWYGGREVLAGRLTGGQLVAFLVYGLTVAGSFAGLVGVYAQFQEAIGATRRVFQFLDMEPAVTDKPDAVALDHVEGRITFDAVTFTYDDKQDVLNQIDLDIAPGEVLALVGPSGAGKSTMFNLIPRFYDPTSGRIQVDGHDLRDVTQASLRAQIGIVPQETLLFGGTIRENIRYGNLDASEEAIVAAAKAANAHDFITELPDGYEATVGERGIKLSGGQRQRIAIARAILKDPRILLLDEATSSLDSESEHLVQEALNRLMRGRTTVIIAHRLSTIRIADRIAVLDKGAIVEIGTHEALMDENGLYARLYDMQFKTEALEPVGLD